jgi:hypothetical protein
VLLCSRRHTLVHAQGFQLTLAADRRLRVTTADGRAVPHLPLLPWGASLEVRPLTPLGDGLTPVTAEPRMDLAHVVSVMLQQAA